MSQDAILLDVAPEMASVDAEKRGRFLGYAAAQLGSIYGSNQDLATAYMAAHMLTLAAREGKAGAVKSRKSGDTEEAFYGSTSPEALMATSHGQALRTLSRQYTFLPRNRMMQP
jgi:hypothetical protein